MPGRPATRADFGSVPSGPDPRPCHPLPPVRDAARSGATPGTPAWPGRTARPRRPARSLAATLVCVGDSDDDSRRTSGSTLHQHVPPSGCASRPISAFCLPMRAARPAEVARATQQSAVPRVRVVAALRLRLDLVDVPHARRPAVRAVEVDAAPAASFAAPLSPFPDPRDARLAGDRVLPLPARLLAGSGFGLRESQHHAAASWARFFAFHASSPACSAVHHHIQTRSSARNTGSSSCREGHTCTSNAGSFRLLGMRRM